MSITDCLEGRSGLILCKEFPLFAAANIMNKTPKTVINMWMEERKKKYLAVCIQMGGFIMEIHTIFAKQMEC